MASSTTEDKLPIRAAGGGQLSVAATEFGLKPFSGPVLAHLVSEYKTLPAKDGQKLADEASFLSYMTSDKSTAMAAPANNDLNYPLSSYFISSSHNTYLSGNQLYGEASVDAYETVLRRGCRCLEIDVWDGESDSDTSSSDDEDERAHGSLGVGRERSDSKPSRWGKVKARAAKIRQRSRSNSRIDGGGSPPAVSPAHPQARVEGGSAPPSTSNYKLPSPLPSPSLVGRVEPQVLHGYTLTQPVSFRSVCHAIKASAFLSTDLPVIVSLEVHASLSQQEIMVEIMREIWTGFLVDMSHEHARALPSPEALRRKILIKVKWAPNTTTGESNNPIDQVTSRSTDGGTEDGEKTKKASKVLTALSELGVYTRAYTFKHFSQPEASIPTHVFSLSENKMHSMHSDPSHGPALFDHNKTFLMRVFPKGTRINSSNVDPTFHWRQGAQMVALNWQKMDKGMMLNEGMFAGLGGWVLKPEGYRGDEASRIKAAQGGDEPDKRRLELEIRLLAGQRLPLPADKDASHGSKVKPYVKLQLHVDTHGPPGQGKVSKGQGNLAAETDAYGGEEIDEGIYKRRSVTRKTDCPDFEGERLSWLKVPDVVDELSFLRYVPFPVLGDHTTPLGNCPRSTIVDGAWLCLTYPFAVNPSQPGPAGVSHTNHTLPSRALRALGAALPWHIHSSVEGKGCLQWHESQTPASKRAISPAAVQGWTDEPRTTPNRWPSGPSAPIRPCSCTIMLHKIDILL